LARPSEVVERLNRQFSGDRSGQFFTLFYGVLDLGSFDLRYTNAGHPGPVIVSENGAHKTLQNSGLPVGVVDEERYEEDVVRLQPGDRFWLYSDGLKEAMNLEGEQFGMGRLTGELQAVTSVPLRDGVERLLRSVEQWAGRSGPPRRHFSCRL
jgi:sigma-B regulation protein RsbU (phosphoserine phosphatase)